jgi:hypothetical protein
VEKGKSVKMETKLPRDPPDAAVLDYLGRYGDAAIGLDPLGLADDADAAGPPSGRKDDER